eukprot:TRINITY_DN3517_c0_g1_i1.p1 TRINITY_DN3517_c0_g1~~TRINITY_DN3517_c0_g1_i1.p1  ORF type:complete len:399 (-),score=76.22 TRINITY_DN3517_c0_g1_i1:865-2061(-)
MIVWHLDTLTHWSPDSLQAIHTIQFDPNSPTSSIPFTFLLKLQAIVLHMCKLPWRIFLRHSQTTLTKFTLASHMTTPKKTVTWEDASVNYSLPNATASMSKMIDLLVLNTSSASYFAWKQNNGLPGRSAVLFEFLNASCYTSSSKGKTQAPPPATTVAVTSAASPAPEVSAVFSAPAKTVVAAVGYGVYFPSALIAVVILMVFEALGSSLKLVNRKPALIILEILSFSLAVLCFSLIYVAKVRVGVCLLMYFFWGFVGLGTVIFRMCDLYLKFCVTNLLNQRVKAKPGASLLLMSQKWWIRNRRIFSKKRFVIPIIFAYALLGLCFVFAVMSNSLEKFNSTSVLDLRDLYMLGVLGALFHWISIAVGCVYLGIKIRNAGKETLGIKRELSLKVVSAIL